MPTAAAPTAVSPPARRKKPPSFTTNLRKKKSSPVCAREIFACPRTFITPSATSTASSPQSRYDCRHHGMTSSENWPRIAVLGAGAVGGYFGGMLARAGAPVIMIGRATFVEAVRKNGLLLDTLQFQETLRVEASTELEAARGAEVILFCVKTTDTESTARALA